MAAAELRHRFHRFRLPPRVRAAQAGSRNGGPACMDRMCGAETYADQFGNVRSEARLALSCGCAKREGGKPHGTRRLHRVAEKRCVLCTWVSTWPVLPVNVEDPASLRTLRPTSRTGAPRLGIGRNPLAAAIHSSLRVTTPTVNLTLRNIDVHSLRSRPRLRCIGCGHPAAQPRGESIMDRANPVPRAWLL